MTMLDWNSFWGNQSNNQRKRNEYLEDALHSNLGSSAGFWNTSTLFVFLYNASNEYFSSWPTRYISKKETACRMHSISAWAVRGILEILRLNICSMHSYTCIFVWNKSLIFKVIVHDCLCMTAATGPVLPFSKLNKIFVGYFDPENIFLDNKNN